MIERSSGDPKFAGLIPDAAVKHVEVQDGEGQVAPDAVPSVFECVLNGEGKTCCI